MCQLRALLAVSDTITIQIRSKEVGPGAAPDTFRVGE